MRDLRSRLDVFLETFHVIFWNGFSQWTWSSCFCLDWLANELQRACLCSPTPTPKLGLQIHATMSSFYAGSREPNSGPRDLMIGTFLTEPSSQPRYGSLLFDNKHYIQLKWKVECFIESSQVDSCWWSFWHERGSISKVCCSRSCYAVVLFSCHLDFSEGD